MSWRDDIAPIQSSKFTQEWEIKKKIPGMTWTAQSSDMNIIENIQQTIKVKLHSETDWTKCTQSWRTQYARLGGRCLVDIFQVCKRISHKTTTIHGMTCSFSYRKLRLLLLTSAATLVTYFWSLTVADTTQLTYDTVDTRWHSWHRLTHTQLSW